MLELKDINITAGDFSLNDISLKVQKGGYHALVGPSGSGKTMLLNAIAGFQKITGGEVFADGKNITKLSPEKRNISYLFQDLALFPHMDVFANVAYPLRLKGLKKDEITRQVDEYLGFTNITNLKSRAISKLSGGEKQRVALARILVSQSPLILLDEPFSAIDTQLQPDLAKLLKRISALGKTIVHVSHNYDEIIGLAETVSVIENGRLIQSGNTNEVFNHPYNSFVAGFSGIKNYFKCNYATSELNEYYVVIGERIKIAIEKPASEKVSGIIIDSSMISVSIDRPTVLTPNIFKGKILNIIRTRNGYDLETDTGVILFASMKEPVAAGSDIWLYFNSDAVRVC